MDEERITWGVDKGSPDGDSAALTLLKNGEIFTFTGEEAYIILEYVAEAERLARIAQTQKLLNNQRAYVKAVSGHINNSNTRSLYGGLNMAKDAIRWLEKELVALSNKPKEEK
jgi:hypothetical protein